MTTIHIEDEVYTSRDIVTLNFPKDYSTELPIEYGMRFWEGGGTSIIHEVQKPRMTFTKTLLGYIPVRNVKVYTLEPAPTFFSKDKKKKVYKEVLPLLYIYVTVNGVCFASTEMIREKE